VKLFEILNKEQGMRKLNDEEIFSPSFVSLQTMIPHLSVVSELRSSYFNAKTKKKQKNAMILKPL
jgi:hypothetical protein